MSKAELTLMEYIVTESDSIEKIAAIHDCTVGELMKLNRLGTRMVFPGQKLVVPYPMSEVDIFNVATTENRYEKRPTTDNASSTFENEMDGIRYGPGFAIQVYGCARSNQSSTAGRGLIQMYAEKAGSTDAEVDTDCLKRFIKLKVKQITETNGTVTGTLLVTPNALMFDPDVMDPLVMEKGQNVFIMMARMEEVISVALFKDMITVTAVEGGSEKFKDSVLDSSGALKTDEIKASDDLTDLEDPGSTECSTCDLKSKGDSVKCVEKNIGHVASESELALAVEKKEISNAPGNVSRLPRRTYSDLASITQLPYDLKCSQSETTDATRDDEHKQQHSVHPSTSLNGTNGDQSRGPLSRLGRTLSVHAHTIRGSVASGAERVTQTAISGTKTVAQGLISQSKAAAGSLQTGIQTGAKAAACHAKTAVDAVVGMPQGIANISTGLFTSPPQSDKQFQDNSIQQFQKKDSLATLMSLKESTQRMREIILNNMRSAQFVCATSMDEMPDLFKPMHELLSGSSSTVEKDTLTESTYYMVVRLNRKKIENEAFDDVIRNRVREEFWFIMSGVKADAVCHFLLQWCPENSGTDVQIENPDESVDQKMLRDLLADSGFVILFPETDNGLLGEKPSTRLFGSSYLHPEWEIVTVKEMCRRLSLDQLDKVFLPLPDGATSSQILDEAMLRQMVDVLPARATGYPWINIYNSEKHGFSLHTFYRKMIEWDEEMSPVLLIIRDCEKNVFGAIVSTTVRPSEHFFGTGDSCLLYKYVINPETGEKELRIYPWSGQNQFFVKASRDSLVVGAGGGHYGLWLDADLNHGRSQACETFHNEPLTNENEDFTVQFIEAYGFRME